MWVLVVRSFRYLGEQPSGDSFSLPDVLSSQLSPWNGLLSRSLPVGNRLGEVEGFEPLFPEVDLRHAPLQIVGEELEARYG